MLFDRAQEIAGAQKNLFGNRARQIKQVSRPIFVSNELQYHFFRSRVAAQQLVKPLDLTNCESVNVTGVAH